MPDARFVPLDGENHILLEDEPAWRAFYAEVAAFLDAGPPSGAIANALTEREREVVALVAAGCANDEIAQRLRLSVRTVERHLSNIYSKLGVSGKAARAAAAARYSSLR